MADVDPKISNPTVTTGPIRGSRKFFIEGRDGVRVARRAIDL